MTFSSIRKFIAFIAFTILLGTLTACNSNLTSATPLNFSKWDQPEMLNIRSKLTDKDRELLDYFQYRQAENFQNSGGSEKFKDGITLEAALTLAAQWRKDQDSAEAESEVQAEPAAAETQTEQSKASRNILVAESRGQKFTLKDMTFNNRGPDSPTPTSYSISVSYKYENLNDSQNITSVVTIWGMDDADQAVEFVQLAVGTRAAPNSSEEKTELMMLNSAQQVKFWEAGSKMKYFVVKMKQGL